MLNELTPVETAHDHDQLPQRNIAGNIQNALCQGRYAVTCAPIGELFQSELLETSKLQNFYRPLGCALYTPSIS